MVTVPYLDLRAQYHSIKPEIDAAVLKVLESTQYTLGDEVFAFERGFADYCASAESIAVNSGTSALHLALLACGVGPGDEVITIPFTFDGAGQFCWQAASLGGFINSWNTVSVSLNGMNVTNIWVGSGSYPAKINNNYYVSYNSSVAWGHFEARP